ncbi:uncharacterized protein AB675_8599 [Cyphellophora attinorum]|uniref:Uncharacterized protein n=1 Tax=Cyphellophora attinorum TaxID=1664694 RepID=A0A0N0NQT9_9EURO|nr:uncharacterized protein AB675_8599 [Phialophora attinorum]KPI44311.1 hypothetical protein AB675_8599 [Phialophora attinorum]
MRHHNAPVPKSLMNQARTALEALGYTWSSSTKWASGDLVLKEDEPGSHSGSYFFVVAGGTRDDDKTDEFYVYTQSAKTKDGSYRIPKENILRTSKGAKWVESPKYFDGSILAMDVAGVELSIEVRNVWRDEDGDKWVYEIMDHNRTQVSEEQLDRMVGRVMML